MSCFTVVFANNPFTHLRERGFSIHPKSSAHRTNSEAHYCGVRVGIGVAGLKVNLNTVGSFSRIVPDVSHLPRHVVTEDQRTLATARALRIGDLTSVGRYMAESHVSMRDDYQISCPELNLLVELANLEPSLVGSRMTGGGFGGCTVNLVRSDGVPQFSKAVAQGYESSTGRKPDIYISNVSGGACELPVQ